MSKKKNGFCKLSDVLNSPLDLQMHDDDRDYDYWYPNALQDYQYVFDNNTKMTYVLDGNSMTAVVVIKANLNDREIDIPEHYDYNSPGLRLNGIASGAYTVKYVYVRTASWQTISLPSTVEDVIIDRYKYGENCSEDLQRKNSEKKGGKFSLKGNSSYLYVDNDGSLYSKDKSRLISLFSWHDWRNDKKVVEIPDSVKEIDTYAIPYLYDCEQLVIPANITEFDVPTQLLHTRVQLIGELIFKGKLTHIVAEPEPYKEDYRRIKKYRINNTIDNVVVDNADKQLDSHFIFRPTINAKSEPGKVMLTRAGATIVPGRQNYIMHSMQCWAKPITINVDFVAYVNPVTFDCYEQHEGCEIMLLSKDAKDEPIDKMYPVVCVYEDYETVISMLNNAGWTKR